MAGDQYQVLAAPPGRGPSMCSLTDGSDVGPEEEDSDDGPPSTPLRRLTSAMRTDEKVMKELIIGRRVGFYKVRGEIGYGTFSRVKLAFHVLTKGGKRWCAEAHLDLASTFNGQHMISKLVKQRNVSSGI